MFYSHTYGEAFSFGLDPEEVASVLAEAAKPQNYTELEEMKNENLVNSAENIIESDKANLENKADKLESIKPNANGSELVRDEDEETATNTTDNTSTSTPTDTADDYLEFEE